MISCGEDEVPTESWLAESMRLGGILAFPGAAASDKNLFYWQIGGCL